MHREKRFKFWKSGNKYHAKRTEYGGGLYHSKLEARVASDLDLRLKAGDIASVERQVKMPLEVNGKRISNYFVDFKITHNDGTTEYIEVKGMVTPEARLKMLHFEAQYCDGRDVKYTVMRA